MGFYGKSSGGCPAIFGALKKVAETAKTGKSLNIAVVIDYPDFHFSFS